MGEADVAGYKMPSFNRASSVALSLETTHNSTMSTTDKAVRGTRARAMNI